MHDVLGPINYKTNGKNVNSSVLILNFDTRM